MTRTRWMFAWFGVLFILLIIVFPMYWGLRTSLTENGVLDFVPGRLTLMHYDGLFAGGFLTNIQNSLIISMGTITFTLPIALMSGYALARFDFPGKRFSAVLLVLPLLPAIAVLVPLILYMRGLGIYNTLYSVILAGTVFALPYCTWMIRGFMLSIPREIEEAALIDGCGPIKALFSIAIPLAAPGLISVAIFTLISAWNNYLFSFAFTTKRELQVVPAALLGFITAWGNNYGGMNAGAVVAILPPLIFFLIFQKWFIQGILAGSSK
ncbi:MAG: carbohydrate ABC transporter permease [Chloroflexi bacterium]|nr:carbohydrate ABC transporter permease [Chloroflexota bacterium]